MYDVLNTITGKTEFSTVDRRLAEEVAKGFEQYKVLDASRFGYMYRLYPRPRFNQLHQYDIECRAMLRRMVLDYMAQAGDDTWDVSPRWVA